jgi:Uncharacterized protein conserved in bacteria
MRFLTVICFVFSTLIAISAQDQKREMRAVWIATVANIDFPSSQNLNSHKQKAEIIDILNKFQQNKINAIVVQIRPTADAFYYSKFEPWSYWLTGKQGVAPEPYYDPLQFIIEEAHKRFIDVHVWLNPYRVTIKDLTLNKLHPNHLFNKKPELFVQYGDMYYFNPGLDETRQHLNKVVLDVVERYDIDAIHFDDYFYPYKVAGKDFPDQAAFESNPRGFLPSQKNDWRRNNVDMIIAELQSTIKSAKPWVEFGISPFGVWRNSSSDPRGSATNAGVQNYDDLYADILKWLKEGSIDYVTPQIYWEIGHRLADYNTLAKWWSDNSYGKNLYIGLAVYRLGDKTQAKVWNSGNEILNQLNLNKKFPEIDGVMYYNTNTFLDNRMGLNDSLQKNYQRYPAICPINRNIVGEPSAQPQNIRTLCDRNDAILVWDEVDEEGGCKVKYYVVYAFKGKKIGDLNNPANILTRTTDNFVDLRKTEKKLNGNYTFVVTAVNRFNHESIPTYAVVRKL